MTRLTPGELDAIEALSTKATPGPWRRVYHGTYEVEAPPNQLLADFGDIGSGRCDASLVVALRNAAPALLASARALETAEARYERANEARVVDRCASGIRALATPPAAPEVAAEPPQPTADAPRKQPTVTELEAILRGEGGPWRVEMQPDGQIRAVPLAPADAPREYACASCEDTHRRVRGAAPLMCTSCPVPCEECRASGPGGAGGPYCSITPCLCPCHDAKPADAPCDTSGTEAWAYGELEAHRVEFVATLRRVARWFRAWPHPLSLMATVSDLEEAADLVERGKPQRTLTSAASLAAAGPPPRPDAMLRRVAEAVRDAAAAYALRRSAAHLGHSARHPGSGHGDAAITCEQLSVEYRTDALDLDAIIRAALEEPLMPLPLS